MSSSCRRRQRCSRRFANSKIVDAHSGFDHVAEPPRSFSATRPGLRGLLRILKFGQHLGVSSRLAQFRQRGPAEFVQPIFQLARFSFNTGGQYGANVLMNSSKLFA